MNKFKMEATNEEEEVDIIIQWSMPKLNKHGFYCLFKIPLLKIQKQITEQQKKLQRQRIQSAIQGKEGTALGIREFPKINPLHLAYSYNKRLIHDFTNGRPAIVEFSLSLSNMIQSQDHTLNCKVEGLNEWTSLSNPTDVSEANSFLWIGKTQHVIRNMKSNVSVSSNIITNAFQNVKNVTLRCAIIQPGVFNLNRFRVVLIDQTSEGEQGAKNNHFMSEIRLQDDILITVLDSSHSLQDNDRAANGALGDQLLTFD